MRLFRTEYWNLTTGTPRGGSTAHGESLVDVESYLEPLRNTVLGALLDPGVADGLQVTATIGTAGLTVSTGLGIDGLGRVAVLSDGGAAIVDASLPPDQMQQVPVVLVGPDGVQLPTAGPAGDAVLTLTWREVLDSTQQCGTPTLLHAPWLRAEAVATFTDDGSRVVLAAVSVDDQGAVTSLMPGIRRPVRQPSGGLTFRQSGALPGAAGDPTVLGQPAGTQLIPRDDGGLDVQLPGSVAPAVSLQGGGLFQVAGPLRVDGPVQVGSPVQLDGQLRVGPAGAALVIGDPAEGGALDVPRRARLRQGPDVSAGLWLHQNTSGDAAFLGMEDDTHVGMFGRAAGFALSMDVDSGELHARRALTVDGPLSAGGGLTVTGLMHVAGSVSIDGILRPGALALPPGSGLTFDGQLRAGGVSLPDQARITGDGRLHITGPELLFLLNHDGVIIGREWGGNGNLTVEGRLTAKNPMWAAGLELAAAAQIVGDGRLHITGPELLYLLNHDGVIIGQEWGGSGNLVVEGDGQIVGMLRVESRRHDSSIPALPPWSGGGLMTFDVFAAGALYVGKDFNHPACSFYSDGRKAFAIDHPLDPEHSTLHHICIEGPEAAVYYRGSAQLVDGRAEVELPDYFEALTRPEERTVMLTPVAEDGEPVTGLAASPVRRGRFSVRGLDAGNPSQRFCWQVTAVRADVEPLEVVTTKVRREAVLAG